MADNKSDKNDGPELYDVQLSKIDFESPLYKKHGPKVEKLSEKLSDDLRNVYSLLPISPEKFPGRIRSAAAQQLVEFMRSPETQTRIAEFGRERFGRSLFVSLLPAGASATRLNDRPDPIE